MQTMYCVCMEEEEEEKIIFWGNEKEMIPLTFWRGRIGKENCH